MGYRTIPHTNVQYALISFDGDGAERKDDPAAPGALFSDRVLADAKAAVPSHVFLFCHGWKGDLASAADQYDRWISSMMQLPADQAKLGPDFRPLWIGLHWPSLPLGQEKFGEGDFADVESDPDSLKQEALRQMGDTPEIRQALDVIFQEQENNAAALVMPANVAAAYRRLASAAGYTAGGPGGAPDAEGVPFDPETAFETFGDTGDFSGGGFFGKLLSPLIQLSYWRMKYRARSIGEAGMHRFVAQLQQALPAGNTKIHLIGHSFGCIVVSSIVGGPGGKDPLPRPVDSLALLQGAVSLWAYGDHVKDSDGKPGYYNTAFRRPSVRGPVITTRSSFDSAVGKFYPLATALFPVGGGSFAPGDDLVPTFLPLFGGLGTFGMRGLDLATDVLMLPATGQYTFQPGRIYNLKGDDYISGHNAIDNAEVAHALWQAAWSAEKVSDGQAATPGN